MNDSTIDTPVEATCESVSAEEVREMTAAEIASMLAREEVEAGAKLVAANAAAQEAPVEA